MYDRADFEQQLNEMCELLTEEAQAVGFTTSKQFEKRVRELALEKMPRELNIDPNPPDQIFPDIPAGEYGIEVKFTAHDTWRCVANSVFEGRRARGVKYIDLVYCKMGGVPEVRWGRYENCACHVRTSHVPRFEVDIDAKQSIFDKMKIGYEDFSALSDEGKMSYIRSYARGRLEEGEHLWWLDSADSDGGRTVPVSARLYTTLSDEEKRTVRAEAALLSPQIVGSGRYKYGDVALFLLTYHGIAAHQTRDLFSAGSASHDGTCPDADLVGNYVACALFDLQQEMRDAAEYLPAELFNEYWGISCPPEDRIRQWLVFADKYAAGGSWVPSEHLFL